MDETTKYLIERMDTMKLEIRHDIAQLSKELRELQNFRQRTLGMAALISFIGAGAVDLIIHLIRL